MTNWKEPGDGEYTRILDDGAVAKVFEQTLFWRGAVDDRMADNIYFDAREAMEAVDAWETGGGKLTFHPDPQNGGPLTVNGLYQGDELHLLAGATVAIAAGATAASELGIALVLIAIFADITVPGAWPRHVAHWQERPWTPAEADPDDVRGRLRVVRDAAAG